MIKWIKNKTSKKRLNVQFSCVRERIYRRDVINKIVIVFQAIEGFMEIQVRNKIGEGTVPKFSEKTE